MTAEPVQRTQPLLVRIARERDRKQIATFLEEDPFVHVYLIARVLNEPDLASAELLVATSGGRIAGIAIASGNVVVAVDRSLDATEVRLVIDALADAMIGRSPVVRAVIAEADLVEMLWQRLQLHLMPPTVVRLTQPIYVLTQEEAERGDFPASLKTVRRATRAEHDILVAACSAMHLEEVGINPLDRDAAGYRDRVRDLIDSGRALVLMLGREIAFKCEISAVTPAAVQLTGVWTAPHLRRKGFAQAALREICGGVGRQGKAVTLFVNDFNAPAIRLYEQLGFRKIGTNRALIW